VTMREKMARAIHKISPDYDVPWDEMHQGIRDLFLADADAALAALEEPTDAMVEAGYAALTDNKPDPADIYQAMIRAAGE